MIQTNRSKSKTSWHTRLTSEKLFLVYFEPHSKGNYIEQIHSALEKSGADIESLNLLVTDQSEWPQIERDARALFLLPQSEDDEVVKRIESFDVQAAKQVAIASKGQIEHYRKTLPKRIRLLDRFDWRNLAHDQILEQLQSLILEPLNYLERAGGPETKKSALQSLLERAIEQANDGLVPRDLLHEARQKARGSRSEFLEVLSLFSKTEIFSPTDFEYSEMIYISDELARVGAKVTIAMAEAGLETHSTSEKLWVTYVEQLAHSPFPEDREKARIVYDDMFEGVGNTKEGKETWNLRDPRMLSCLSYLLDAYHRDGKHNEALSITTSLLEKTENRNNATVLRNHARALERDTDTGHSTNDILDAYWRALAVDKPDDTTTYWFAQTLEQLGHHDDAIRVAILGCMLDLNDARNFARLAELVADRILPPSNIYSYSERVENPSQRIGLKLVVDLLVHISFFDPAVTPIQVDVTTERVMRKLDITDERVQGRAKELGPQTQGSRCEFILTLESELGVRAWVKEQINRVKQQSENVS